MKILLALDGSECSAAALESIAARPWPAPLAVTILHALDLRAELAARSGMPTHAEAYATVVEAGRVLAESLVEAARAKLAARLPGADVRSRVTEGAPAAAIVTAAADSNADLIVVGAHGHGALARMLLGSVSSKVALQARCAVEVVKKPEAPPPPGFRLLLATDFSVVAGRAVERVLAMSWPAGTEVRIVTSIPPLTFLSATEVGGHEVLRELEVARTARREVERKLAELRDALAAKFGAASVNGELLDGDPRDVLVDQAARWPASLVVLGSHGRTGLKHLLLGSVAHTVLHAAPCSVQIVK